MSYTFSELQTEVKARSIKSQGGTNYDTQVKNAINGSIKRISMECPWKQMRCKSTFTTDAPYTTGTVTATNGSTTVTGSGTSWLTNGTKVGRRITIQGSSLRFIINAINSETSITINRAYDGTTASSLTYTIYGTEEYNLPIQTGKIGIIWHEQFGYPYRLRYITDQEFYSSGAVIENSAIPRYYRQWGEDWVLQQPTSASVLRVYSSSSADTSIPVTVFGTVSSYPDSEIITTNSSNGTTAVSGTKSFSSVERIVKSATSTGRITVDSNSAAVTVGVLPTGSGTYGPQYKKIQLFPLPNAAFPINVQFYKEPYSLVNSGDIHEFGDEFDEAIILFASAKIMFSDRMDEANQFFSLFQDELRVLRRNNMDRNLDWKPALLRPKDSRMNSNFLQKNVIYEQLGGSYGPMSYGI